jgi:hypothetical protein
MHLLIFYEDILLQILRLVFRIGAAIISVQSLSACLSQTSHCVGRYLAPRARVWALDGSGHAAQFVGYEMLTKRILKKGRADRSLDRDQQRRHSSVNLDWQP